MDNRGSGGGDGSGTDSLQIWSLITGLFGYCC